MSIADQRKHNKQHREVRTTADAEKPKRKTRTSNEVKARYNAKTYTRMTLVLRKEKAQAYKDKCKELGITYSEPLHDAVDDILNK